MNEFIEKLREGLDRLTLSQKVRLAAAALTTLGLVWGLSVYATRIRYDFLAGGLGQKDAAALTVALDQKRIPYRLSDGGTTILVPAGRVDAVRLELAGENLMPGGGVGFEIFDKPAFGLSDFVENVNYRRALERELGRTIQSLAAVKSARVHLALPKESVFADEQQDPSASVVVQLGSGGSLPAGRVQAITHLVASGVEGLDAQRVSVIDGQGRMLTDGNVGDEPLSDTQLEAKHSLERNIESTLVSILEPIVGPGRARARATVELNMTRVQRTEETFDPNVAVVRSEQKTKSSQSGAANGGTPGTPSNLPGGAGVAAAGAQTGDKSQSTTTNFELNKTTSLIAEPVGTLAKQSVAVVVDHALVETTGEDGQSQLVPTPRPPEEMRKITDLVRAAIGIDDQRGDVLIVENVPFDEQAFPGGEAADGFDWTLWTNVARYGSLPLAVILLALLVIRPGIAALRVARSGTEQTSEPPQTIAHLQAQLQAEMASGAVPGLLQGDTSPMRRKLIEAVGEDPRSAALVVKDWLEGQRKRD